MHVGIEYDPATFNKNFIRSEGFAGSIPRLFTDRNLTRCPLCQSHNPNWSLAQKNIMLWRGILNFFKCGECGGVITVPTLDINNAQNSSTGYITGQNFVNMAAKKKSR